MGTVPVLFFSPELAPPESGCPGRLRMPLDYEIPASLVARQLRTCMWKAQKGSEWLVVPRDRFYDTAAQIFAVWLEIRLIFLVKSAGFQRWSIPEGTIPYRDIPRNAPEHLVDISTSSGEMWEGIEIDRDSHMPNGNELSNAKVFADNFIRALTDRVELSREDTVCLVGRAPGWARVTAAGILAGSQFRSIAYCEKGRRLVVNR